MLTIIELIRKDIDILKSRLNAAIETFLEPSAESGQEPHPVPDARQDPGQVPVNHQQNEPDNETAFAAMDTSVVSVDLANNSEDDLN